ncbi:MAG TPA: hypothetical protein DCR23_04405 [Ruminococcaceae bacterium]|nr:hypothetical protein [Oscillospiraceae bacterium]
MLSNNNREKGVSPYVSPDLIIEENKEIKYDEIGGIKAVIDKAQLESRLKQGERDAFWRMFKKACIYVALFGLVSAVIGFFLEIMSNFV